MLQSSKFNLDKLTPELKNVVINVADTIKPLIEDIHSQQATGQNYYNDYMRILGIAANKQGKGFVKIMAISMLYLGCNPIGVDAAVKNII